MFAVPAHGQTQQALTSVAFNGLPDAPDSLAPGPKGSELSREEASASISGKVLDANGGTLSGARITLTDANNSEERTLLSGSNGEFSFSELPAGNFKLTIT
jgi:hypothetical protein